VSTLVVNITYSSITLVNGEPFDKLRVDSDW